MPYILYLLLLSYIILLFTGKLSYLVTLIVSTVSIVVLLCINIFIENSKVEMYNGVRDKIYLYGNILVLVIVGFVFLLMMKITIENLLKTYTNYSDKCSPFKLLLNFAKGTPELCGEDEQRKEMEARINQNMKKREKEQAVTGGAITNALKKTVDMTSKFRFANISIIKHIMNVIFNISTTFVEAWIALRGLIDKTIATFMIVGFELSKTMLETMTNTVNLILEILDMLMIF